MKRTLVAASLALTCLAHSQELILNGSFENPVIGGFFQTVNAGSSTLTNWFVGRTSIDIVSTTFAPSFPSRDGNQHVDIAGTPGPGLISQFFSTTAGTDYVLRFSASSNGSSRLFEVYWEGAILTTPAAPAQGTWQDFQFILHTSSSSGMVGFGSLLSDTNQGALIDSVSVQVVPEPLSMAAFGLGLAALVLKRRKTRA